MNAAPWKKQCSGVAATLSWHKETTARIKLIANTVVFILASGGFRFVLVDDPQLDQKELSSDQFWTRTARSGSDQTAVKVYVFPGSAVIASRFGAPSGNVAGLVLMDNA